MLPTNIHTKKMITGNLIKMNKDTKGIKEITMKPIKNITIGINNGIIVSQIASTPRIATKTKTIMKIVRVMMTAIEKSIVKIKLDTVIRPPKVKETIIQNSIIVKDRVKVIIVQQKIIGKAIWENQGDIKVIIQGHFTRGEIINSEIIRVEIIIEIRIIVMVIDI